MMEFTASITRVLSLRKPGTTGRADRAKLSVVLLACALLMALPVHAQRQNIIETGNFEPPNDVEMTNPYKADNQIIGPFTIERCGDLAPSRTCPSPNQVISFVSDPAGGSGKVAKFVMQTYYERAEVRAQRNGSYPYSPPPPPTEVWYGWRLYLPANANVSGYGGLVSQWHAKGNELGDRGVSGSPSSLRVNSTEWNMYIRYQSGTSGSNLIASEATLNLGSNASDLGRWTEWVMQVKWTSSSDGFLRLWKNGTQVIGGSAARQWENKATFFNVPNSPYFKMGIYRGDPGWTGPSNMTIYGDDYRLGNENATFCDVSPSSCGGGGPTEIIIDNGSSGFSTTGAWTNKVDADGYDNDYAHDGTSTSDSNKTVRWTPTITQAGNYNIYMRWPAYSNRPDGAPLEIKYNGGTDTTKRVNQRVNDNEWVLIGNYSLSAGTGNYVMIKATDPGYTIADAVRFEKQ